MSDTPRTDATVTWDASFPDSKCVVPAEFARELERELNDLKPSQVEITGRNVDEVLQSMRLISIAKLRERLLMASTADYDIFKRMIGKASEEPKKRVKKPVARLLCPDGSGNVWRFDGHNYCANCGNLANKHVTGD